MIMTERRMAGAMGKAALHYAISAMAVVSIQVAAPMAQAQTAKVVRFDIAPQSLGSALAAFTQKTGITLAYGSTLPNIGSQGATGTMSAAEALSRILAGSGLTYRFTGANTVTLEHAPQAADGTVQLGPVRVEGAGGIGAGLAASPASDMLATEGSRSYTTRGAVTSSKLPLTLRETPQSITVITRQQIEDRNFITIDDAIEAATGMSATTANLGSNTFNARGFSVGNIRPVRMLPPPAWEATRPSNQ